MKIAGKTKKLRTKTVQPEFEAAIRDTARSGCEVDTEVEEDDIADG